MMRWLIAAVVLASSTIALHEDQFGKYDWSIENMGRAQSIALKGRRVAVAADSGAVGVLDAVSGDIKWRSFLPNSMLCDLDPNWRLSPQVQGHSVWRPSMAAWQCLQGEMDENSHLAHLLTTSQHGRNVCIFTEDRPLAVGSASILKWTVVLRDAHSSHWSLKGASGRSIERLKFDG